MTDPRTPLTPDDLRALADSVEKWSALICDDSGNPVDDIECIVLDGNMGRIVCDHTGAYWGWTPE